MKKLWKVIVLIGAIAITMSACITPSTYEWKPCMQPNTQWVSEDGTIGFCVSDGGWATGTISINGESIEIYLSEGPERSVEMHIYPISVLEQEVIPESDKYEHWMCEYVSEDKFVATVNRTTFLEEGKKITFHKAAQ